MHILVISQFYYPEMGAPAARFYDFSKYWIEKGHEVTVVTAFPNFPDGKIDKQYRRKFLVKENIRGVNIVRTYIWASPKLRFFDKAMGYITYAMSSTLYLLFKKERFDVIIATSPPPNVGIPAVIIKKIKRIPLVFDVRDFWPENLINSERLKNKLFISTLNRIVHSAYKNSRAITVVTKGKKEHLDAILPGKKVHIISNGVDVSALLSAKKSDKGLDDIFNRYEHCFVYAGVFNPAQGLNVIIRAVEELSGKEKNQTRFGVLLIGDGSEKQKLQREIKEKRIENIHIVGIKPKEVVFSSLKRATAILITLKRRKDTHTVPSKIYESMASKRPVLLSASGEPADIISDANAGLVSEPEDHFALANNMKKYIQSNQLADQHGVNGLKYCNANYDRKKISASFLEVLKDVTAH